MDLINSLGLNPMAQYSGRSRRLPFPGLPSERASAREPILSSDNPFAPAVHALDNLVRTYQEQRQESAMMDAIADALALELSRYAQQGKLPEKYVQSFTNFNSQPLSRKRALEGQGLFLLGQHQEREQLETEQARANAQAFGSLISRLTSQADTFLRRRSEEAQQRREQEEQDREQRVLAEILHSAGIKVPESAGGRISPNAARVLLSTARDAAGTESLDEAEATRRAADLNKRLKGTQRRAIPMPVDKNRWKVAIVPERAGTTTLDPRQFDVNQNQRLDPDEYAQFLGSQAMQRVTGGVYPGMDLNQWNAEAVEPDEDWINDLLKGIDPRKLINP